MRRTTNAVGVKEAAYGQFRGSWPTSSEVWQSSAGFSSAPPDELAELPFAPEVKKSRATGMSAKVTIDGRRRAFARALRP
jgi:hypothetical protein